MNLGLVYFSCSQRPFCFLGKWVVLTEKKKNNPDLELNFELIEYLPKENILIYKITKVLGIFFSLINGTVVLSARRLVIANKESSIVSIFKF